jgi:hypothetical protein
MSHYNAPLPRFKPGRLANHTMCEVRKLYRPLTSFARPVPDAAFVGELAQGVR